MKKNPHRKKARSDRSGCGNRDVIIIEISGYLKKAWSLYGDCAFLRCIPVHRTARCSWSKPQFFEAAVFLRVASCSWSKPQTGFWGQMFSYGLHAVPETKRRLFLGRRRFRMFPAGIVRALRKMLQFGIAIIVHIC